MLSLDSKDWQVLTHAYGPATDIPNLLRQLALDSTPRSGYQDEPWFSLWSALCHQEDVYSASFAALPHVVEIGTKTPGPIDSGFFLFPACIEVFRHRKRAPQIPAQLAEAYFGGLRGLHECAFRHASDQWDSGMARSVAAALAAAKGQLTLAEALIKLDNDMIARIVQLNL